MNSLQYGDGIFWANDKGIYARFDATRTICEWTDNAPVTNDNRVQVKVSLQNNTFSAMLLDEYNAVVEKRRIESEKQQAIRYAQRENELRLEGIRETQRCKTFWSQYKIPFAFTVEIKERLDGLSANSHGNGFAANTKMHIYLKQPIEYGKLKRQPLDFLCSDVKANSYGDWTDSLGKDNYAIFDDNGAKIHPIIDCKTCLKRMLRFKI